MESEDSKDSSPMPTVSKGIGGLQSSVLPRSGFSGVGSGRSSDPSTLGHNQFRSRVEAHVQDVRRGRGERSRGVAADLNRRNHANSEELSRSNPRALSSYRGLLSGLSYDKNARLVASVHETNQTIAQLRTKEEVEQITDEFLQQLEHSKGETLREEGSS